jgi:inosose dehydratase
MASSRREFFRKLAVCGASSMLPRLAMAGTGSLAWRNSSTLLDLVHPSKLKIEVGYASITWGGHDTEAIEDVAAVGYPGIQLRSNVLKEFPDPHQLRDLLAQHQLKFVALSSGNAVIDPAERQSMIDSHVEHAKYLKAAGGGYLQLVGSPTKTRESYSAADYKYEGELLADIGKHVLELGIRTGFHNHMNTIGQTPEAVEAILAAGDPRYIHLELDVAHYLQGGGDPAMAIRKYAERLLFLHFKDVKDTSTKSGYEFVELGQGRVNFPAIVSALESIHYKGWAIVELDGVPTGTGRTPKQCAQISKDYLENKLGIHV